jgi:hypothetical protein
LLQERLRLYGLTLLVIASGYWLAFYFIWRGAPGLDDDRILAHIFAPGTFALLAWYAVLWLLCRGKPLRRAVLPWIDLGFHAGPSCRTGVPRARGRCARRWIAARTPGDGAMTMPSVGGRARRPRSRRGVESALGRPAKRR